MGLVCFLIGFRVKWALYFGSDGFLFLSFFLLKWRLALCKVIKIYELEVLANCQHATTNMISEPKIVGFQWLKIVSIYCVAHCSYPIGYIAPSPKNPFFVSLNLLHIIFLFIIFYVC